jgi:hypothetical protein
MSKELSLCVADVGYLDPWQVYACASSECGLGERRVVRAENIFLAPRSRVRPFNAPQTRFRHAKPDSDPDQRRVKKENTSAGGK